MLNETYPQIIKFYVQCELQVTFILLFPPPPKCAVEKLMKESANGVIDSIVVDGCRCSHGGGVCCCCKDNPQVELLSWRNKFRGCDMLTGND
jgi:hypothetical protein